MFYRAIGIMSGSSLDGLDICFAEIDEVGGRWSYKISAAECLPYPEPWKQELANAIHLPAGAYLRLHAAYGRYIGEQVNNFIEKYNLHHQIALVASHGHTVFHEPGSGMTAQLGDGATIAAVTGLNVVSDLRSMDVALGGQGAPIVPIGEKLLFNQYPLLLNIGGIANISFNAKTDAEELTVAFDVCPANRVLNLLVGTMGLDYDADGRLAASGTIRQDLLHRLNEQAYYGQPFPKSLANHFGTDILLPILQETGYPIPDLLRTYVAHVSEQVKAAVGLLLKDADPFIVRQMLVTGGGALNMFLVKHLQQVLQNLNVELVLADQQLILYKEALIMALVGILRWREEENVLASVTGASRNSVGGALWLGNI